MTSYLIPDDESDRIIAFDVITMEAHESNTTVTEHPVELGANIADHARTELDLFSLEGFISNTPLRATILDGPHWSRAYAKGLGLTMVPSYQGELSANEFDLPATPGVGLIGAVGSLLFGPGTASATMLSFDRFDAIREVYEELLALQREAVPFRVLTSVRAYESLIIKRMQLPRRAEDGTGAVFSLTLGEIRVVESGVVAAPEPEEPRGAPGQGKGGQGSSPTTGPGADSPVDAESMLHRIFGSMGIV